MSCPTEYTWSVYADGELPEAEALEAARHLDTCEGCSELVALLRGENRVLIQCLQDVELDQAQVEPAIETAAAPVDVMRWGMGVVGMALAFRVSTSLVFGFRLPPELQWLDPRAWATSLGVVVDAVGYAVEKGSLVVANAADMAQLVVIVAATLGMLRILSRKAAVSAVLGAIFCVGLFSSPSYAIDIRKGAAASIPAGETVDDTLWVSPDETGRNITVAGMITGDLIAIGDVVTISGDVQGNVLAVGRRVEISGSVGGSAVGIGRTVVVSGTVARNLSFMGSDATVARTAIIGGNAAMFSGESVVEGAVQQDIFGFTGVLDLRGEIGRDVVFRGGQISVASPAHVGRNLIAHVAREENLRVESGAVIDGERTIDIVQNQPGPNRYLTLRFYVWQVVWIIAAFITGSLLLWLVPGLAPGSVNSGLDWLKAGGLGLAILVTVPVAVVLAGITIIGLPVALLSLVLWCAGIYMAKILVAEFIGRSVLKTGGAVSLLAGLLIVLIAVDLPWIGGLINFLLVLLGLGSILLTGYRTGFRREPAGAAL